VIAIGKAKEFLALLFIQTADGLENLAVGRRIQREFKKKIDDLLFADRYGRDGSGGHILDSAPQKEVLFLYFRCGSSSGVCPGTKVPDPV
jgi:hypothetical protein